TRPGVSCAGSRSTGCRRRATRSPSGSRTSISTSSEGAMPTVHDPSTSSYYVNDALYRRLIETFADWQRDELAVGDPAIRDQCRRLLEQEARLLDALRFEEWLALYAGECIYWVPATPGGGDPRREVAISFDDRRRLEDRIYRLRTGYAWSQ